MYYEEKLIDGILHWRGTPDGEWQIVPAEKLGERETNTIIKLYADCKTDTEKASFFRSGRGWESGIVAKSLEGDLVDVFTFRATVTEVLALYECALTEAEAILGGEYGDEFHSFMEAVDKARTAKAAMNLTHKEEA